MKVAGNKMENWPRGDSKVTLHTIVWVL